MAQGSKTTKRSVTKGKELRYQGNKTRGPTTLPVVQVVPLAGVEVVEVDPARKDMNPGVTYQVYQDIPVVGIKEAVVYSDPEGTYLDIYTENSNIVSFHLAANVTVKRVLFHRRNAQGDLGAVELDATERKGPRQAA